ncbi:MAG: site-2 protease family protein, partial [Muribaculaceae bacterium]|nr:site-2 protease family protein [Muribaculaceae bacterium]
MFFHPWFSLLKWNPKRGILELLTSTDDEGNGKALIRIRTGRSREDNATDGKATWRDTIYGIGWLPFGGYCKIAGMIDESMDKEQMTKPAQPWEFRSKKAYQRLMVMVGGVLFNFLLAVVIYIGIAFTWGEKTIRFEDAYAGLDFVPAAQAVGFRNGDIPMM